MTTEQQQSMHFIYVNICNALFYADDLLIDDKLSKPARDSIRVIRDKVAWIKRAMEIKTNSSVLQKVDTLRYDEIIRVVSMLPKGLDDELEKFIVSFVNQKLEELNQKNQ